MSQVLYLKWRPGDWDEVIGQDHIITTLKNSVRLDRISHAQIFSGPRGTGKTSTARVLAKAVNCLAEDPAARPCVLWREGLAATAGHPPDEHRP